MRLLVTIAALAFAVTCAVPAAAQHPIEVQRATASGDYMLALTTYERMPRRVATSASMIAAARSAWALSMPRRAIEEYDRALQDESLSVMDQARIYLSKGIIEFQETHYQVAALHAERALSLLAEQKDESSIGSKAHFLLGEAQSRQSRFGDAERNYIESLTYAASEDLPQFHFALGKCKMQLSKYAEAQAEFEKVPLGHELTPFAMRYLAITALESGKLQSASFWLTKGRQDYPDSFLDSWVDYALLRNAVDKGDAQGVRSIRESANKKYPASDPWLTLLNAAAEGFEWNLIASSKSVTTSTTVK